MDFPTIISLTETDLDINSMLGQITLPTTGAAAIFTGVVRGQTSRGDSHETDYLEYEAYQPMAETKMRQVADEIRQKWPSIEGIRHRTAYRAVVSRDAFHGDRLLISPP